MAKKIEEKKITNTVIWQKGGKGGGVRGWRKKKGQAMKSPARPHRSK